MVRPALATTAFPQDPGALYCTQRTRAIDLRGSCHVSGHPGLLASPPGGGDAVVRPVSGDRRSANGSKAMNATRELTGCHRPWRCTVAATMLASTSSFAVDLGYEVLVQTNDAQNIVVPGYSVPSFVY
ncbi:MAG: hypothetical protein ACYSU7_11305 [Planctomycetota bacterium]